MDRKAPPQVEFKWQAGSFSFKAVGECALILSAALFALFGLAYLLVTNWEKIVG